MEEHLSMNASFPANSRRKNANRPEGNVGKGIEPSNKAVRPTFFPSYRHLLIASFPDVSSLLTPRTLYGIFYDDYADVLRFLRGWKS